MMMRLYDFDINGSLEFEEGASICLTIENKRYFKEAVDYFKGIEKDIKRFSVTFGDNELVYQKDFATVIDYYDYETVSRTISAKTLKFIAERISKDDETLLSFRNKISELHTVVSHALYDCDIEFEDDPVCSFDDVLKLFSVTPSGSREAPIYKYLNMIELAAALRMYKLIVFVNIKSFFEKDELIELQKLAAYKNIALLLIENTINNYATDRETNYLIDDDLFLTKTNSLL